MRVRVHAPWYRRAWRDWPVAVQGLSLAAGVVMTVLVVRQGPSPAMVAWLTGRTLEPAEAVTNQVQPTVAALQILWRVVLEPLVPGLFAHVRVPVAAPQPTLLISERAIGTDQSQKYVLAVAADRTVLYRTVKLGGAVGGLRIVREGLRAGDRVIVNGLQHVRPGMVVDPEVADGVAPVVSSAGAQVAAR